MGDSLASSDAIVAVILAAGYGSRLRPLTLLRPKALCPVGNVALVDLALDRARQVTPTVAVNVHHHRDMMEAHLHGQAQLHGQAHLSFEREPLGTAGALGRLRPWIAGRDVLVVNADAWHKADLAAFAAGWDHRRIRLLTVRTTGGGDWGDRRYAGAALMPWAEVRDLTDSPSGLYEMSWSRHDPGGGLDLVDHAGPYFDCGTPARYLAANMAASGGAPVVGKGCSVEGTIERCVLWDGARVKPGERLFSAIRTVEGITVVVGRPDGAG